jgi:hypothetical protein
MRFKISKIVMMFCLFSMPLFAIGILDQTPVLWMGSSATAPTFVINGDAYYNTTDNKSYIMKNNQWTILADVSTGNNPGDMQYWDGVKWVMIPVGTPGQILTLSPSKVPIWSANYAVSDIDGNLYHAVTIGTQTWMMENLKTTTLNDGTPISKVTDNSSASWYCWYNNDITNKATYGALYNA